MNKLKLTLKLIGILLVFFFNIDTTFMESINEQDIEAQSLLKTFFVCGTIIFALLYISEGREFSQIFEFEIFQKLDPLSIGIMKYTWKKIFK